MTHRILQPTTLQSFPNRLLPLQCLSRRALRRRKHNPRLDDIDGRRSHRTDAPRRARAHRRHHARLQQRPRAHASTLAVAAHPALEVLEQWELHGSEGQIAAGERRVAAPERQRGAAEAAEREQRRVGGRGRRHHLRVLLDDLGGRQDGAADELGGCGGRGVDDGGRDGAAGVVRCEGVFGALVGREEGAGGRQRRDYGASNALIQPSVEGAPIDRLRDFIGV